MPPDETAYHLLLDQPEAQIAVRALRLLISDEAHEPTIRTLARQVIELLGAQHRGGGAEPELGAGATAEMAGAEVEAGVEVEAGAGVEVEAGAGAGAEVEAGAGAGAGAEVGAAGGPAGVGALTVPLTEPQMKITHTAVKLLLLDTQREQESERQLLHAILAKLPDEHALRAIELD